VTVTNIWSCKHLSKYILFGMSFYCEYLKVKQEQMHFMFWIDLLFVFLTFISFLLILFIFCYFAHEAKLYDENCLCSVSICKTEGMYCAQLGSNWTTSNLGKPSYLNMPYFSAQELHFDALKYDLDFYMTLTFTDKFSKFKTIFNFF
jgi:hypothetical protein